MIQSKDSYILADVASFTLDLDAGLEEVLEFANLHNTILDWVSAVDGESVANLLGLLAGLLSRSHFGL